MPLLQILIVLSHVSVDKFNIAKCNTFKSDAGNSTKPLEAFSPLESFRIKWITLITNFYSI